MSEPRLRLAARAAVPRSRAADATQGHPGASWARLAALHGELAECYRDLAERMQNPVAGSADSSNHVPVEPERLLTVADLAERLAVDQRTIRRWRTEGRLPKAIQIGGVIRWRPQDFEAWLEERAR